MALSSDNSFQDDALVALSSGNPFKDDALVVAILSLTTVKIIMSFYADIWDVLKCDGEFYIVIFNTQDPQNPTILAPRSGQLPPSTRLYRLDKIVNIIPPPVLTEMVENWLKNFGHIGHIQQSDLEPEPCSMNDLSNLKLAINIFQVD